MTGTDENKAESRNEAKSRKTKTMKIIFSLTIMLLALTVPAREPQYNGVQQFNATVPSAGSTNIVCPPFRLGPGGTLGIEVSVLATNAGTSNVIGTVLFSASGTAYTTTGLTFTNALNGTNPVTYLNSLSIPDQAKFAVLTNLSTTQTTAPAVRVSTRDI